MGNATLANALWSFRRYVQANVNPLAKVYYAPPQEQAPETLYVLFAPLRLGTADLVMWPVIRLTAVARGETAVMGAEELASSIMGVFQSSNKRVSFGLYDKPTSTVIGSCSVMRVDAEPIVQFPDGTDVVPVDVTFRFRSTYAPRV